MDVTVLNELGAQPLKDFLEVFHKAAYHDKDTNIMDIQTLIEELDKKSLSPFSFTVATDEKNITRHVLVVSIIILLL